MSKAKTASVRELFFKQIEDKQEVVDVTAPSGFVYKFRKPSKFGILFSMGKLPQSASAKAAYSWMEQGVMTEDDTAIEPDQSEKIRAAFQVRDKVLALSVEPKLVIGAAQADNEVSTDEVPDGDLDYLFKWVAAGGDTSAMLGTFPTGRQSDALDSAHRPAVGNAPEPVGGDQ